MLVKCSKSCSQKLTIQKFGTGITLLLKLPSHHHSFCKLNFIYPPKSMECALGDSFTEPRHQSLHDDQIFVIWFVRLFFVQPRFICFEILNFVSCSLFRNRNWNW
jgi:hypothetical protein